MKTPEFTPTEAKAVSLAALDLLLKVSAVPEMKTSLRCPQYSLLRSALLSDRVSSQIVIVRVLGLA